MARPLNLQEAIGRAMRHHTAGEHAQAEAVLKKILKANPREPNALHLGGLIERTRGRPMSALERIRAAIEVTPNVAERHADLGATALAAAQVDRARDALDRARELRPADASIHSSRLLAEHYDPAVSLERLATLHAEWNERHAAPHAVNQQPHETDRDPDRPLRIGFLSPDLYEHPVGIFLVGVLESIGDRAHTTCYANGAKDDAYSRRIRAAADDWHNVAKRNDAELARAIRDDRIDVLFDLAGHTARNRLGVFARKPAPVQVTWAGYVGTTGLTAMDFLLADAHQLPEDAAPHIAESILRLPGDYVPFDPPADAPEPGSGPTGPFTFGCFNYPAKLNLPLLETWAEILEQAPESRLVLRYRGLGERALQKQLLAPFTERGVDGRRVIFKGGATRRELLAAYREVDVALDPFPYSGGLTTFEAAWMGTPVLTKPGETFASRHSLTHMSSIGLPDYACADETSYVRRAVELASDPGALRGARSSLRSRMQETVCDAGAFTEAFLDAVRGAWRTYAST